MSLTIKGKPQFLGTTTISFVPTGPNWDNPIESKVQGNGGQFGLAVSISADSNTAIVGAKYDSTTASNAGSSYIYVKSGSNWVEQQIIESDDLEANDYFGYSVSISGDGNTAIVGSRNKDTVSNSEGKAYIFTRSGSTWSQQQAIQASNIGSGDFFGHSVSLSADGQTAIVGAPNEDSGGSQAGSCYVFARSGETWTEQQRFNSTPNIANSMFGWSASLSADGNTAVIGAYQEDVGGVNYNDGAAYIFTRSGNIWTQRQQITPSDLQSDDKFGTSVNISGNGQTVIVGSPREGASDGGAAYIFTRSGETWTQQQKIKPGDIGSSDDFGFAVSIIDNGNTVLIGSTHNGNDEGAGYVYTRTEAVWTLKKKIIASDAGNGTQLGTDVSIANNETSVLGAFDNAIGAAYFYS